MPRKKVQEPVNPEVQEDPKDALPISADQTEPAAETAPQEEPATPSKDITQEDDRSASEDAAPEEPTPTDSGDAASPHEEGQIDEMSKLLAEMDGGESPGEDTPTPEEDDAPAPEEEIPPGTLLIEEPPPKRVRRKKAVTAKEPEEAPPPESKPASPSRARAPRPDGVLTIEARGEVVSEEEQEETLWHEVRNAYRSHRILTGPLSGVEQLGDGKSVAVVDYKGFRVIIPVKEMMLRIGRLPTGTEYAELMRRQNRILGSMLGAELDFVVKGIENKSRSVVASREEAMLRKRKTFYLDADEGGLPKIYPGRIVQARITAVAEKVVRVEAFGVECSLMARELSWDWIGDARERFSVGDRILIRVKEIHGETPEELSIEADARSVSNATSRDRLKLCRVQGKYAGTVTDVRRGVVYIRLNNGVNAIAHACYDFRMPGKKDDVSFAVTRLDEEYGVAVGIITRIIKQNL